MVRTIVVAVGLLRVVNDTSETRRINSCIGRHPIACHIAASLNCVQNPVHSVPPPISTDQYRSAGSSDRRPLHTMDTVHEHISALPGDKDLDAHVDGDNELMHQLIGSHPCFSQELLRADVLQLLSHMTSQSTCIQLKDVPVVGRRHEERYMRPATRGERACVRGDQCFCNFLAKVRHGAETEFAFIGCEFKTPDEEQVYISSGKHTAKCGHCIICKRYLVTLLYTLARCNPRFNIHECGKIPDQAVPEASHDKPQLPSSRRRLKKAAYTPSMATDVGEGMHCDRLCLDDGIPMHANLVDVHDGYRRDKTLFVEEEYADSVSMRETEMGSVAFRPFVRFCTTDYAYVMGENGCPYVVQLNVASDRHLNGYASPAMAFPGALQKEGPSALGSSV